MAPLPTAKLQQMTVTPHRLFQQPWPEGDYRLFQLGFVVDDLVEVARQWARIHGVGPFLVLPRMNVPCTYRGTPGHLEMQIATAQAGPAQIELIAQYSDTPSIYREFVAKGHSVFHQICTVTPDYDGKKAYYESLGIELASEIIVPGQRVAFYDTVSEFGLFTEVAEQSDAFLESLDRSSQACAQWDGVDPVRIMMKGGYRLPEDGDL
jgi:Glyoxalase/Bleomycin resistance protein/Dioxygenase superfamily